jgi:hypothetical protein
MSETDGDVDLDSPAENPNKKQFTDSRWKAMQEMKQLQDELTHRMNSLLDPADLQAGAMHDTFTSDMLHNKNLVMAQEPVPVDLQAKVSGILRRASTGNLEQLLAQASDGDSKFPDPDDLGDCIDEKMRKSCHAGYMRFWRSIWTNKKNPAPEEVKEKAIQVKRGWDLNYCLNLINQDSCTVA